MSTELSVQKPGFLANEAPFDMSDMSKYLQPPRLKIIQSQAGPKFKPQFRDGDIIVVPKLQKIGDGEEAFTFVPVYFFPEFTVQNPYALKETMPFIRDRSLDDRSDIAQKCRNFISEPCPESPKHEISYKTMLHFLCLVPDFIGDIPIIISFSSGEYKTGQQLIGMVQARNAPLYACRFRANTEYRTGKVGNWYGLSLSDAPEPWVTEEQYKRNKELHDQLKKEKNNIVVDLDDTDMETQPSQF